MYTVWHVDKHKITFKLTDDKFQNSLSRPSIIDARAHCWAAARRLRSIGLVVRVLGYRFKGVGSIPRATRLSEEYWVRKSFHLASGVQLRNCLEEKVATPV
jgi:hypothetical protein